MKKVLLLVVIITMLSCSVLAASFSDLASDHWAYKPISDMTAKGILNGYPDGTFKPNQSITRAEFAKILTNTLNLPGDSASTIQYKDVPADHWAYSYIAIASNYLSGYQSGDGYSYMPDSSAIREDMALAMVSAMGLSNNNFNVSTLDKFSDKDLISENLKKYVAIAAENGIMNGNAEGTFNPKGYLTRAQVCQLMQNALDNLEKASAVEPKPLTLSADKKDGASLGESDKIKLTALNYDTTKGALTYNVYYNNKLLLPGSFKDGDTIKISDFIEQAKKDKIDLYGKKITLELYFSNIVEDKIEGKVSYTYKIKNAKVEEDVELSASKKNGSELKETDSIKLYAENFDDTPGMTLDFSVFCDNKLILPGSFKDGDSIKVKDLIDYADKQDVDLYGKEIILQLYVNNISKNKVEDKVTYNYKIESKSGTKTETKTEAKTIPIKEALVEAQFKDKTLEGGFDSGSYSEFYVKYNRPLKEAKVEAKDQKGNTVKLYGAKVAAEFEEDAVKNDISSVRIRIKFEYGKKYTFTVKDVVDKEGNKIENYSFNVYTIARVEDALVEAQLEGETLDKINNGLVYESFVKYNRPLKEAMVEIRDKNGLQLSNVEGKVADEYEDDAKKNDISTVRIRAKYEANNEYTVTVKNVVDKDGIKIEDYSFSFKTKAQ